MNYLFILLLTCYPNYSYSKVLDTKYNITTYHYNTHNCSIEPFKTESLLVSSCKNQNMCSVYKNHSMFSVCTQINIYKSCGFGIVLTLLITSLFFLLYKTCCNNCLDNYCYSMYDSMYYYISFNYR